MTVFPRKIKSLQGIIYISLIMLIVMTISIFGFPMINLTRNQVSALSLEQTKMVLDHLEQSTKLQMERVNRLSDQLVLQDRLREYLSIDNIMNHESESETVDALEERFNDLVQLYDDVESIFVFSESDTDQMKMVSNRRNIILNEENPIRDQEWYLSAKKLHGILTITPPHLQNFIKRNYIWVVSFSRTIMDRMNGQALGVLLIDTNINVIKDICTKNSTDTHYYYIVDDAGNFIFHPHLQLIYSGLFSEPVEQVLALGSDTLRINISGDNRIYTVRKLYESGWRIVAVTDVDKLYAPFNPPLAYMLIWIGLSLIILLIISRTVVIAVLNPINRLRYSMKEVEEGHFDISVNVSEYAEVGALAKDFNIMVRKIGDLIDLNEEEHRKLRISDFNALQSQMNPHFLYNTLDSVIWMSAKGQSDDVITMVSSLSKLLRRSLATGDSLVPLEEEYDHAKQYCIIQKIRYKDQLDFSLNLPEDCRNVGVPRLILQPLIENALYHGIEDWEDGAQIRISAERFTESLKITVSDNGKGADPAELEAILSSQLETRPNSSVGLKNINDRLKILFGESGSMGFLHQFQGGLDVVITIPL